MSKKILILTFEFPPFRGGIGRYASQIALGAHRCGCEVVVAAPNFKQDNGLEDQETFPFEVKRFKGTIYSAGQFPAMVQRIRSLIATGKFDVIHAIDWPNSLALTLLNRFLTIPYVATIYGTEILGVVSSRHVRYLSGGKLFSAPRELLAISQFTKELLLSRHPEVDAGRIRVTPLGVDPVFFEKAELESSIRSKYNIPADRRILLTVSRLDERKGHRVVLQGLAELSDEARKGVTYVITGESQDARYLQELKELASSTGVPVVFTGAVSDDELRALYAEAYVFCMPGEPHPTKVEGFGLAYLEAAAQGLPSIASSIGAIPEVVLHEKTGLLIEPMKSEAMSEALMRLLAEPEYTRQLGEAARTRAAKFTWESCARESYRLQV